MAATFIQVTLDDFEKHFSIKNKKTGQRVFELAQPSDSEAYYTYTHKRYAGLGQMVLRVLTTLAPGSSAARKVGQDAIRCYVVWQDENGWEKVIGKTNRTYRSGGAGATPESVIQRTLDKCREALKETFKACPRCSRPMVKRKATKGISAGKEFWGCVAFASEGCKGYAPIEGGSQ